MKITDSLTCTGCAVCADSCPKQCITISYDKFGFCYPKIDKKLCINCKQCISTCPSNNNPIKTDILSIYKGYAKNIESDSNQKSTSGAIFALLAEYVINKNGVVVGVSFDNDFLNASHIICENMEQVDKCRGSKYIQSKTYGIYRKVKVLLKEGRLVLFSGTPCQVSALNSYLKNIPENLITVDFICHGVASTTFYQEYVKSLIPPEDLVSFSFRDKNGAYLKNESLIIDKNNKKHHYSWQNGFGMAFGNNLISRPSCGTCNYATKQRVSDISLADNILLISDKEKIFGSSFIFINSLKGSNTFNAIRENAYLESVTPETLIPRIMHLNHPANPHKDRDKLMQTFAKKGYAKASLLISNYIPKQKKVSRFKILISKFISKFFH